MLNRQSLELLAPAGDEERLEAALSFGADAVYLGGERFGMRTAPQNFTLMQLTKAVERCHQKGVKVYLTCNTLPRNSEIALLPDFLTGAAQSGVDAFIITDLGVMDIAKKLAPDVDIHISTQAGVTNYESARVLHEMGAKRIVIARELQIEDIAEIRAKTPKELEIECFVHGAMCVSFSGRCLLSNYMTGRDSNRGDCAQPCRWKYALTEEKRPGEYFPIDETDDGTFIMNSRDMCMIEHLPILAKAGVSSFKIEGRAKSAYYTAAVVNAYSSALKGYIDSGFNPDYTPEQWIVDEVHRVSYRDYCTGFYFGSPKGDSNIYYKGGYIREWEVAAIALGWSGGVLTVSQRNRFFEGDELDVMCKGKKPFTIKVTELTNETGDAIDNAPHPMMTAKFACPEDIVPVGAYLRRPKNET